MKLEAKYLIFLGCFFIISSCSLKDDDGSKPLLAVSIEPQQKILEEIAGDNFEVISILSKGANPESFDPTVSQRRKAANAKAYFTIGYLPFEETLSSSLGENVKIVNTSAGIVPVTGTHSHGPKEKEHDNTEDPHIWTSINNGKLIAYNMYMALAEIDDKNKDEYWQRYTILTERLDSIDAVIRHSLESAKSDAFAVWHPSLSYFARDYGLHQISVGQESKEISPTTLREVVNEAKKDSVKVFFFQKEYDSRQAENINKEIGARLIPINPLDYNWENELIKIADELTK